MLSVARKFLLMNVLCLTTSRSTAFVLHTTFTTRTGTCLLKADTTDQQTTTSTNNPLGLTPELLKLTNAFEQIGDDKLRYKQLLYMANQLPPMDATLQVPENKVPGCLSTVYIDGQAVMNENGNIVIEFTGDSDGLLTKGLVALLIRGLNGNTSADIQKVDPQFIQQAGIAASLTPGRNNGFLNMLAVMKQKALDLETNYEKQDDETSTKVSVTTGRPMYDKIMQELQKLNPQAIQLTDNSHQHAGHAGAKGLEGEETHFDLYITSDAFENLNLIKRHQLVYMMLGEVMPRIHALQIRALTPEEAEK